MLEPLLRRLELVFFFQLLERWRTEKPHPLIGTRGWIKCDGENEKRNSKKRTKYLEHARIIERSRKGNKFVGGSCQLVCI